MNAPRLRAFDPARPPFADMAGLDVIRAFAAIGVVLLHACVPYVRNPMPGLAWPVKDGSSVPLDFVFWAIELVVMPLFLAIAGYLAWQTYRRSGPSQLVRKRAKRLLIPLAFGFCVILPLDLHVWVLGWVADGLVPAVKLRSFKFDGVIDRDLWGTSHLWFLLYLFTYIALFATAGHFFRHRSLGQRWLRAGENWLSATFFALLFLVAAGAVALRPEVVWGFQHGFLPVPSKWLYCAAFFGLGIGLAAWPATLRWAQTRRPADFALVTLIAAATLALGRWHLGHWRGGGDESRLAEAVLAGMTTASAAAVVLLTIGWATRRVRRVPVVIQYLAAASFWVYLVHHPVMGLIHIDLKHLAPGTAPELKAFVTFAMSMGISLTTYECWVRKTRLGRLLGFAWTPQITAERPDGDRPCLELRESPASVDADPAASRKPVRKAA